LAYSVWGIFFLFWIITAMQNRQRAQESEPFFSRLPNIILYGIAITLLIFDLSFFAPFVWRIVPDGWGISLTGLAIQISGLGFASWARMHLGKYWSARVTLAEDHQLIQSGPYQLVRNPMYLGILLGMFGTAVVIGQLRGMLAATAVLFALLWKIKAEEKILSNHFGERFQQYKKNAKSIIPFIY
jgi:protein-S-isoprenylcysteine O-methyltransferase Ste14